MKKNKAGNLRLLYLTLIISKLRAVLSRPDPKDAFSLIVPFAANNSGCASNDGFLSLSA
jgi:hypothetical protein